MANNNNDEPLFTLPMLQATFRSAKRKNIKDDPVTGYGKVPATVVETNSSISASSAPKPGSVPKAAAEANDPPTQKMNNLAAPGLRGSWSHAPGFVRTSKVYF